MYTKVVFFYFIIFFISFIIQEILKKYLLISPFLILIVLVYASITEGVVFGEVFGFLSGLFLDMFVNPFLGIDIIIFSLIGYGVGKFHKKIDENQLITQLILVVGSTLIYFLLFSVLSFVFYHKKVETLNIVLTLFLNLIFGRLVFLSLFNLKKRFKI